MDFILLEYGTPHYLAACNLRNTILRAPLGRDLFTEDLSQESKALHFAGIESNDVLAYVQFVVINPELLKLRQMCVSSSRQRSGLGSALITFAEKHLRERGFSRVTMSARMTAEAFYRRLGYEPVGQPYIEIGVPHVQMQKRLTT